LATGSPPDRAGRLGAVVALRLLSRPRLRRPGPGVAAGRRHAHVGGGRGGAAVGAALPGSTRGL